MTSFSFDIPETFVDEVAQRVGQILRDELRPSAEGYMTAKEAAAYLRLSPNSLDALIRDEDLPFRRVGRKRLFRASEIDAWLDARSAS